MFTLSSVQIQTTVTSIRAAIEQLTHSAQTSKECVEELTGGHANQVVLGTRADDHGSKRLTHEARTTPAFNARFGTSTHVIFFVFFLSRVYQRRRCKSVRLYNVGPALGTLNPSSARYYAEKERLTHASRSPESQTRISYLPSYTSSTLGRFS